MASKSSSSRATAAPRRVIAPVVPRGDEPAKLVVFAKALEHVSYVDVTTYAHDSVASMIKCMCSEIGIASSQRGWITLRRVVDDRSGELSAPLDSRMTVAAAGVSHHDSFILTSSSPLSSPRHVRAGTLPFSDEIGIPRDVWDAMPEAAQNNVAVNFTLRQQLAAVPALTQLQMLRETGVWPPGAEQLMLGEEYLGIIQIPAVASPFIDVPKGFEEVLASSSSFLLDNARVELACEFLDAMRSTRRKGAGVLLSGPNGVGKSSIGLLTFMTCYAQRLPVVYIPNTSSWTSQVLKGVEDGNLFLLKQLLVQNMDLLLANERFRPIILPVVCDDVPLNRELLGQMALVSQMEGAQRVGVILDEVQNITRKVEDAIRTPCGDFFRDTWYQWSTATTSAFVRMDIASSHGLREFKLPSGESHRLRFVQPFPSAVANVFLQHPASPGFLRTESARDRARFVGGGVVRLLLQFKQLLKTEAITELASAERYIRKEMADDCKGWLQSLSASASDRKVAIRIIRGLVQGRATIADFKLIYDAGLVMLIDEAHVVPVSPVAASILHQVVAAEALKHFTPLLSLPATGERGNELESQVLALLGCMRARIPVCSLDATPVEAVDINTDFALPFTTIDAALRTASLTGNFLLLPTSHTFAVDAIISPSEDPERGSCEPQSPVLVIEVSTTHPRDASRVAKILKWFLPGGIITQLARVYARRDILILLCYGGGRLEAPGASASRYQDLARAAAAVTAARVHIVVADTTSLNVLGVVFETSPPASASASSAR